MALKNFTALEESLYVDKETPNSIFVIQKDISLQFYNKAVYPINIKL